MKSKAALFLSIYCQYNAFADAFLTQSCFTSTALSRHQHSSCVELSSVASSSIASPFSSSSIKRRIVPPSEEVTILAPIGNGTFGGVHLARNEATGQPLVAKCARAATPDTRAKENAFQYLEIEAYVNSKLCPPPHEDTAMAHGARHVAPYVGECNIDGKKYLLWEASGEYTLEDYIEMKDGKNQLAVDLGVTTVDEIDAIGSNSVQRLHDDLAAEVLRQILEGLAYCHACGIVHRDVKPANILVDPETHTLRLIDFGSACCMNSWSANKLGFKGKGKGPRSILYCAPEEFVNEEYPYAFDLYGAVITWLRTVLSVDRDEAEEGHGSATDEQSSDSFGLADEDNLFKWRISVRDFGHNVVAWEEYATLHDALPYGWTSLFGSSRPGMQALRLLANLLSFSPMHRMSASEALVGPYLNSACDAEPPPELPPAMPYSILSHVQRWKRDKEVHERECSLEDLFTRVIAVELTWPLGLSLEPHTGKPGARVTGVVEGTEAAKLGLQEGDALLAIGSIDLEEASMDHVLSILEGWEPGRPVPMLLAQDYD